ncbi:hypothetical protein FH972_025841 [Carpinus fangiana]|uniref:Uncharacterized protein n=1 Tax=Carpinus fangiana TaxID=176857 RepID=A0A5N6L2R6_9ROSI|nr:hypothetical protein FH972_025841 [Carpinus fangiana]
MSRPRAVSEASKTPHSVSLKVLRTSTGPVVSDFDPAAALAHPTNNADGVDFILAPVLTLPPAFGTTHVGETFACTLCVNDELSTIPPAEHEGGRMSINGVKITAEMQTPGQTSGVPLDLESRSDYAADEPEGAKARIQNKTHQRIVRWELRDEGTHVLAVTVTYTETREAGDGTGGALGGKVRTFKKLYQFAARHLLAVRTKAQRLPQPSRDGTLDMVLEAQLENVADASFVIDSVTLKQMPPGLQAKSLNRWEDALEERPRLNPRDVLQLAFLLRQETGESLDEDAASVALGQLSITWRGSMGERGSVLTGSLACKRIGRPLMGSAGKQQHHDGDCS